MLFAGQRRRRRPIAPMLQRGRARLRRVGTVFIQLAQSRQGLHARPSTAGWSQRATSRLQRLHRLRSQCKPLALLRFRLFLADLVRGALAAATGAAGPARRGWRRQSGRPFAMDCIRWRRVAPAGVCANLRLDLPRVSAAQSSSASSRLPRHACSWLPLRWFAWAARLIDFTLSVCAPARAGARWLPGLRGCRHS